MPACLSADQLAADLSIRDLTDPAAGPHAIQLVLSRAVESLADRWGCEVRWWRGDRIVTVLDNYDNLGYRADDITRESRYSRYVDTERMLRSHSSALIPPALRALAADPADDVLLACPAMVYRRDSIDRLHTGTPHQLDLWRVTRRPAPLGTADLDEMVTALVGGLLPGMEHRVQERRHPYTRSGRQVDVARRQDWIEIAECGLAHPEVLTGAGLDGAYTGLALGLGLDRMLMLIKGITDIRILRSAKPSVAAQLADLTPYRTVSAMPAIRRDLSVAVDGDDLAEDLGDRVREALGPAADWVETVRILAQTPYEQLPPQARRRLGARPGQKNVLVKVVLRALDRTLTDHDANLLRDRIYAAVHRGTAHQWAVPR